MTKTRPYRLSGRIGQNLLDCFFPVVGDGEQEALVLASGEQVL